MTTPTLPNPPRRKPLVYVAGIALLLCGGAALVLSGHSFLIRSVGIVAIMGSTYLVRLSNVHSRSSLGRDVKIRSPSSIQWLAGMVLMAIVGVACYLLYRDARGGSTEVFPVYLFAVTTVVCAGYWAFLISRFL